MSGVNPIEYGWGLPVSYNGNTTPKANVIQFGAYSMQLDSNNFLGIFIGTVEAGYFDKSGNLVWLQSFQMGGGVNSLLTTAGAFTVYGAIITGGNGLSAVLGNSPTPTAISVDGASPSWSPLGLGLTSTDSTHPGSLVPHTAFASVHAGSVRAMAAFVPQGFLGTMWMEVDVYINISANTLSGGSASSVTISSWDDSGGAGSSFTATLQMVKNDGSTVGIANGATGYWTGHALLPLTANEAGGGVTKYSTQIMQTSWNTGGTTGVFSATSAWVIKRVG